MKTKQLLATLECAAALHEGNGAADKAAALRAFCGAIEPLAATDIDTLIGALTCADAVTTKDK